VAILSLSSATLTFLNSRLNEAKTKGAKTKVLSSFYGFVYLLFTLLCVVGASISSAYFNNIRLAAIFFALPSIVYLVLFSILDIKITKPVVTNLLMNLAVCIISLVFGVFAPIIDNIVELQGKIIQGQMKMLDTQKRMLEAIAPNPSNQTTK
jgi:hypothetical protein